MGLNGIKIGKSLVCGSNNLPCQNQGEKASISRSGPGLGFSPLPTPHPTAEEWRHRKGNHSWYALRVSGRARIQTLAGSRPSFSLTKALGPRAQGDYFYSETGEGPRERASFEWQNELRLPVSRLLFLHGPWPRAMVLTLRGSGVRRALLPANELNLDPEEHC